MNTVTHVPPGFRFHPTDEELVDYYLRRKITSKRIDLDIIKDVDLYKIEPWDLQELCRIGTDEQNDWYFFSHKDKKYPTGTRTNRATTAGFWKATGRDKAIYSKQDLVGMRKTLVFYQGRAPNGHKSDWIMHEYRLENDENGAPQEEGWVVCRVFKKRIATTQQRYSEPGSPSWFDDHVSIMQDRESLKQHHYVNYPGQYPNYNDSSNKGMNLQGGTGIPSAQYLQLPLLESPKMIQARNNIGSYASGLNVNHGSNLQSSIQNIIHVQKFQSPVMLTNVENCGDSCGDQVTDWRVLDKLVASQLSHDDKPKENDTFQHSEDSNPNMNNIQEIVQENTSNVSSTAGCPTDIWK